MLAFWLALPLAALAQPLESDLPGCQSYGAQDFEIGVRSDADPAEVTLSVRVVRVADGSIADQRAVVTTGQPLTSTGCGWVAHIDEGPFTPESNRVDLDGNTLYRIEIYAQYVASVTTTRVGAYEYLLYDGAAHPASASFYRHSASMPQPDLLFIFSTSGLRVYPTELGGGSSGRDVDDFFADDNWILPYDLPTICASLGCDPEDDDNYMFLTPSRSDAPGFPREYTTTAGADWRVPAGRTYGWSADEVSVLRFGAGGRITAKGTFNVDGMTLTASNPSQGWKGVRYNPGSGGTLSGGLLVERVAGECHPSTCFTSGISAAITVEGASPVFDGVTIQAPAASTYLHGLRVTGPNASPLATSLTVLDMTGSAVHAHGGATPELRGLGVNLTLNDAAAVYAAGTGTHVRLVAAPTGNVLRGPQITDGFGGGVEATTLARVTFNGPSGGLGFANIEENAGRGLSATGDADLYAGTTVVQSRNRILGNAIGNTTGNGLASGTGTTVSARCNWWGTADPAGFRVGAVSGATFNATRWLTGDPYLDPDVPCVNAGSGGRTAQATLSTAADAAAGTMAGPMVNVEGTSLADRLADAMEMAPAEQVAALASLVADHPETPEAAGALSTAGALATVGDTPATVAADAVALLEAHAEAGAANDLRQAALGALVGVRFAAGAATGALAAADALVDLGGAAARTGHAARVFILGTADAPSALGSLEALDAGWPESDEADAARAHLAALGVSVPDHRVAPDTPADALAKDAGVGAGTPALSVHPNPSVAGAVVTLTLDEAARVRVSLYDLIGREVVVLLAGEAAAGSHAATVPDGLAPGAYVVRAVSSGGAVVATARLVVVR